MVAQLTMTTISRAAHADVDGDAGGLGWGCVGASTVTRQEMMCIRGGREAHDPFEETWSRSPRVRPKCESGSETAPSSRAAERREPSPQDIRWRAAEPMHEIDAMLENRRDAAPPPPCFPEVGERIG